jgi:putative membrane protein
MITYNPKDWFTLIFQFHKSDTFRRLLPTMFLIGVLTAATCYVEHKYFDLDVPPLTVFHQISGFIISLVLVFRINTAYDRWWEGRKLWGQMVNNCRNLAIRLNAVIPTSDNETRLTIHQLIKNYPVAVKEHLRSRNAFTQLSYNAQLSETEVRSSTHVPNLIATRLTSYCLAVCDQYGKPRDYRIVSENLGNLTDVCGGCERIRNTPIPYSYSIFIKKVIFLYIITMPISFGLTVGYWAVPIVIIMFYAFASLELISEEVEDPFGTDANDLPTDDLANRISENLKEILQTK